LNLELSETEKKESMDPVNNIFNELSLDEDTIPAEAIKGEWI
jgi:hypothetical protein